MTNTSEKNFREGLTGAKVSRFLLLPFQPKYLKAYLAVKRFEDISIDLLLQDGVKGVLLDADGTLGPHHTRHYPDSVVTHVRQMVVKGLQVAIYTNSSNKLFQQFSGIEIVREAYPKPDPRGFEIAMKNHLKLEDPSTVCMVGDNFVTDGGAISAGLRFIYVQPVKGSEHIGHSFTRYLGALCARLYYGDLFKGSQP
jgi:predicted HAD superfamily phosphohydrolase YqeG